MKTFYSLLICLITILMAYYAQASADCYRSSADIICNVDTDYGRWRVGKSTTSDDVYLCGYTGGTWYWVASEAWTANTNYLYVIGTSSIDRIYISDSVSGEACDNSGTPIKYIERFPVDWFNFVVMQGRQSGDSLNGSYLDEIIYGGDGDDYISGNSGGDDLYGENGDDDIYGNAGDDYLDGGDDISSGDYCACSTGTDDQNDCESTDGWCES